MEYEHSFTMTDQTRVIDSMDVNDSEKSRIHTELRESQEEFLENVGELIDSVTGSGYYVETTNQGLNLRIVVHENIEEIVAIAEYAGLTTIERSKTNPDEYHSTWLRFRILRNPQIDA